VKITFNVNSCANIHSNRAKTWDLSNLKEMEAFGFSEEEWKELSEEEKDEILKEWMWSVIELDREETP